MNATQAYRADRILALNAWRQRYDALVAGALGGSARARRQAAALFDLLHERRYAVHRSLESLTPVGDSGLEAALARVETAWAALLRATDEVASRLELIATNQEREHARSQRRAAAAVQDTSMSRGDREHARAATRVRAGVA